METELCTIVMWYVSGTAHGDLLHLTLVYKKGSPLGEGVTVSLPLPEDTPLWGGTDSEPTEIRFSDDNSTLYYSYHYEEPIYGDFQTERKQVHEAGTYQYTVDLVTGEAALKLIPNK